MTTEAAARMYEAQHLMDMEGRRVALFNPSNMPIESLPVIYGFNNGGSFYMLNAVAIAQDGVVLGGHGCSSEAYMPHDLGILEGTRPDRHETYRAHYPNGYRMEFVSHRDAGGHAGLQKAIDENKRRGTEKRG